MGVAPRTPVRLHQHYVFGIMIVRFWGTRGSVPLDCPPALLREKLVGALMKAQGRRFISAEDAGKFVDTELPAEFGPGFGGATSCVEIALEDTPDEVILLDAGTGLAEFGRRWKNDPRAAAPATFHLILSHLHWDHIQGLPFFEPAYVPGNRIIIHTCHAEAEAALRGQMAPPYFPVPFSTFRAHVTFEVHSTTSTFVAAGCLIRALLQRHPGDSFGFRITHDGKSVVYATDAEYAVSDEKQAAPAVEFFHDADLLIFEAMFTRDEVVYDKAGWGHSCNLDAVVLSALARVKRIALFHHDPAATDARLAEFEREAVKHAKEAALVSNGFPKSVFMAKDGLSLTI